MCRQWRAIEKFRCQNPRVGLLLWVLAERVARNPLIHGVCDFGRVRDSFNLGSN